MNDYVGDMTGTIRKMKLHWGTITSALLHGGKLMKHNFMKHRET